MIFGVKKQAANLPPLMIFKALLIHRWHQLDGVLIGTSNSRTDMVDY